MEYNKLDRLDEDSRGFSASDNTKYAASVQHLENERKKNKNEERKNITKYEKIFLRKFL